MIRTILRSTFCLLFLSAIVATSTLAQVTVEFPAISGSPGQTVNVPVSLQNVPGSGFNNYQFDVVTSSGALVFNRAIRAGTLTPSNWLWNDGQNSNSRVLAAGSSNQVVTQSGVVVYLEFEIVSVEEGVTVELQNFRLKLGVENVAFAPAVPTSGLNASNSPVATDDAYGVAEGATLTVSAASGVLANDSDDDGDPLTATVGTVPTHGSLTLNADGSFEYEHDGSETLSDTFTYSVSDGSTIDVGTVTITVTPVNDPPVFTMEVDDQSIDEGDLFSGQFAATDPEGSAITFSLVQGPSGAAINATSGAIAYLATAGSAGTYTITVQASDGAAFATSSFELTVRNVEQYGATLSGIHQPIVVATSATGTISALYDEASNVLVIEGAFTDLGSFLASAQLMMGTTSEAGTGVFNLAASLGSGGTSGSFPAASNTFDLDTATLPGGISAEMVVTALRAGNLFVNLRTLDKLEGELRGQLLMAANAAPSTVEVSAPSSVTVSGDPASEAFTVAWTPGSDPDGDDTKLVLDASGDVLFDTFLSATDVSVTTGSTISFTVADAAQMFDEISGAAPGSIPVGGNEIVYFRLRHTDGAAISTSNPAGVVLTRGMVTGTRDIEIPNNFVLRGNYPNPFNPSTTISFDLPEPAEVQVDVLDLLGRTMISVPMQNMSAGANHSIPVDAGELTSGIYMYRVIARGSSQTWVRSGTMTLIK